ncbi:MAG: glycosyltransferase family 4 protein [Candidatus Micrarchaeia archaeon]
MDLIIAQPFLNQKGGVERVVLEIAKKFNPVIYSVIYDKDKTFEEFKDFDVRIIPKSSFEIPFFFLKNDSRRYNAVSAGFRYFNFKITDDYDVINAQGTPSEWIRNKNERVCWYCHSPNREAFDLHKWRMKRLPVWKRPINWGLIRAYQFAEFKTVPKIEKICANSEIVKERIAKYLKRDDATVIHPGVDPKKYYCSAYEKFFFYASRIVPEKRFEIAIEAFKIFSKNNKDWKLIIAGFLNQNKREIEYLNYLKEISKEYKIEFKLNLTENKIIDLYSKCYATLFSAVNEDWGLIPIESMASNKPCISINEGGPRYSILDGKTGFLVNNAQEMAQKMRYLSENPEVNEKFGKDGQKRVIENYTWGKFLERLEKEFYEVSKK